MVHATFVEGPRARLLLEISRANEARLSNGLPLPPARAEPKETASLLAAPDANVFGNDQLVIEVIGVNLGPALRLPR